MEDLKSKIDELEEQWKQAYEMALSNPSSYQQYISDNSLTALNESVESAVNWLSRVRAPAGFSPGFHIAKSVAEMSVPQLITTARNIAAGQFNHLASFSSLLINVVNSIHSMAVFSSKNDEENIQANMTAELSQGIELLNTAQRELAEKLELIKDVEDQYNQVIRFNEEITEQKDEIQASAVKLSQDIEQLDQTRQNALEITQSIEDKESVFNQLVEEHTEEYQSLLNEKSSEYDERLKEYATTNASMHTENQNLMIQLRENEKKLESLIEKSKEQQELIDSILPKGASAGLAFAFSSRVKQLAWSKAIWIVLFVASLGTLYFVTSSIQVSDIKETSEFLGRLLYKLPAALPLIWLTWFSAIQYGNSLRVQEDYAFKEATSKAFQGYKDHMEHLSNVEITETETAMTLLSASTIKVLGNEPLRLYDKTHKDVSPAHSFTDILSRVLSRNSNKDS